MSDRVYSACVLRHERRQWILQRLKTIGHLSVLDARSATDASPATIRRDLADMESERLLTRVHGGAVAYGVAEIPEVYRAAEAIGEKAAIAVEAVRLLGSVATLGLTGGTTATAVARALPAGAATRVVTNSLSVAMELIARPELELTVVGGRARWRSLELVGELAETAWRRMNVDVAVVGAAGVDADRGLTTHDEVEARTNRALVERSKKTVVVADGSKLGVAAFASICGVENVATVVTSGSATEDAVGKLRAAGVEVVIASSQSGC